MFSYNQKVARQKRFINIVFISFITEFIIVVYNKVKKYCSFFNLLHT
jgi:hypothetical protein